MDTVNESPATLTRILIDLNVRVRGRQTLAGLEDAHGPIQVGQLVEVFEEESGAYEPRHRRVGMARSDDGAKESDV